MGEVGVGKYAKVHMALRTKTGEQCAVKIINKSGLNELEREMLRSEVAVAQFVEHPNVIRFHGVIQSPAHVYIVTELIKGGELTGFIEKRSRLDEDQAAAILYALLSAVAYLHGCGIAHRDIKPENVLLETKADGTVENVKLIDFGFSRVVLPGELMLEQCGTLTYIAPEVLQKYGYGKEADLWSLGIIMYYMYNLLLSYTHEDRLRGTLPYDAKDRLMIVDRILNGGIDVDGEGWRTVSREARDLLGRLLEKSPAQRIRAKEALAHPWFRAHCKRPGAEGESESRARSSKPGSKISSKQIRTAGDKYCTISSEAQ